MERSPSCPTEEQLSSYPPLIREWSITLSGQTHTYHTHQTPIPQASNDKEARTGKRPNVPKAVKTTCPAYRCVRCRKTVCTLCHEGAEINVSDQ